MLYILYRNRAISSSPYDIYFPPEYLVYEILLVSTTSLSGVDNLSGKEILLPVVLQTPSEDWEGQADVPRYRPEG